MQVKSLRLYQYRNFREEALSFSGGTNLFVGRNGQGKTNLLEAIYLLGYGKSFRTSSPKECIHHGERECRIEGRIDHGSISRDLQVEISIARKELMVYGKTVPVDEFVGSLHIVAFTTEHLAIIRGSPAERRGFLDRAMITLYPGHVRHLSDYARALRQRNSILSAIRDGGRHPDAGLLESWDETLVQSGALVACSRFRYAQRLKEELPDRLFGPETLKIHYLSMIADSGDLQQIEKQFRTRLAQARPQDERTGFTSVGPHRDELKVFGDGKALSAFGSAGQQRSALLSLYFAEMEIHRKEHGFYPVFLVDDVEAELDDQRLRIFLSFLGERTQTFLTTAKESLVPPLTGAVCRFEVNAGHASL